MVFGVKTEKKDSILNETAKKDGDNEQSDENQDSSGQDPNGDKKDRKKKNHGRNGADAYTGAKRVKVPHPELKKGDICPDCKEGKLYLNSEPGIELRVKGVCPLDATVYILEKLRCDLCGIIFTAPMPKGTGKKKYDSSAAAMIALLKYGSGLPFNRLERLQANLGVPLSSSTQWDIINDSSSNLKPAYEYLLDLAAQGEVFHNDDTTIKIQTLIKENKEGNPRRKGMFTTGIVSILGDRKIALFLSGRNHAGENLDKILLRRDTTLESPLQMCDALSRNEPSEFITILIHCLIHARRNFVDVVSNFPEECQFVIETLAKVYRFDAETKKQNMTPEQRLLYHQQHSAPLMKELEDWLNEQIDQKRVEPNSGLGDAIFYMLNNWQELTVFLRQPKAPLDNNVAERALKKAILHRKNSLFFKSEHGATVADMYMTLIYTCELAAINPFDYLKALHDHPSHVRSNPADWMPWNYTAAMERVLQSLQ
jgi:transposase